MLAQKEKRFRVLPSNREGKSRNQFSKIVGSYVEQISPSLMLLENHFKQLDKYFGLKTLLLEINEKHIR